ncbi:MAG: PRC-barrel domain-containing protein [Desulfuromonadales bacterium]|nr:PRC-barrel domain-containing protein [Desulfuromonadales bacterium]
MRQLRKLNELIGYHLQADDGEIGKILQVYFDDQQWVTRYFVVRTGNWLLGQAVLIVPSSVTGIDVENQRLIVDLSREQIKNSPPVNTELPVSRHYEEKYYAYYGWQPYWSIGPLPTISKPFSVKNPEKPEHPNLRSSKEVSGYHIHAQDDEIGRVEDFLLEEETWAIAYLEIDTGTWFAGKKVLLSPSWIQKVDWAKKQVSVNVAADLIRSAPEYDAAKGVSSDYRSALHKHYEKKTLK